MAALSMGAFGAYKYSYSKYLKEREEREKEANSPEAETVWVTKRYIPTDLRSTAPVPKKKLLAPKELPEIEHHWVPIGETPLRCFDRDLAGDICIYSSRPCTRSEEWSTLRQNLPSRGSHVKVGPPNWGTGLGRPPIMTAKPKYRYPKVNSPMTNYVDAMHITNKFFSLH